MIPAGRSPVSVPDSALLRTPATWAAVILACHLALGVLYSIAVPAWEAHDEWAHYKYVAYVAQQRSLPPPDVRLTDEYKYDEATQPPLYYVLAALPVMLVDTDDGVRPDVNPYFKIATGEGGINAAVHHPEEERFPWRGTMLALYMARWATLLISTAALAAVYRLGRLLAPDRPGIALTALTFAALSPQYLFIGSVVTNDALIAALGCVIAWLGIEVVLEEFRPGVILALVLSSGLALITKLSAPAMMPFVLLALAVGFLRAVRRSANRRWVWWTTGILVIVSLAPAGWWLWRNVQLTGQLLPRDRWFWYRFVGHWFDPTGDTVAFADLNALPAALWYGFRTFWASFGWGNLEGPDWVYTLFAALSLAGVIGLVWWLAQGRIPRRRKWAVGLLLLFVGALIFAAMYREFSYNSPLIRGRYVLPALGPVAAMLALGIWTWLRPLAARWQVWLSLTLGGALIAINIILPWRVIVPAYAPSTLVADATLLPGEAPLHAQFGDAAELVAYELWPESVRSGEALGVTLLWRVVKPLEKNYTVGVHLLDGHRNKMGEINIYPGRGNYASTIWQPGTLFRDTYWIEVKKPVDQPGMGRVKVALFLDDETHDHLPVVDQQGNALGEAVEIERFKLAPALAPAAQPQATAPAEGLARLGDVIQLSQATGAHPGSAIMAGDAFTLTLTWDVLDRPAADYNVFVHLEGAAEPVAYGDGPPADGTYPTGLWARGERIEDRRVVRVSADTPAGEYPLVVGLYDVQGGRLPVTLANGSRPSGNRILLDTITVVRRDQKRFLPLVLGELLISHTRAS